MCMTLMTFEVSPHLMKNLCLHNVSIRIKFDRILNEKDI